MIEVNKLNLFYDKVLVFSNLCLRLERNEKIVIFGESGSGKSSFFKLLLGFERACSGSIEINGIVQNERTINDLRSYIAWVPQEISIPVKTLREAADQLYSLKANTQNRPSNDKILALLERLGVTTSMDKHLSELSGGERQRFFITLALLLHKPILLLDEPTSALDATNSRRLGEVLKTFEMSMIAISHDHVFIESFDRKIEFINQQGI